MKGVKGKIIKKLKTIQALGSLRHGLVFHLSPSVDHNNDKHSNTNKISISEDDDDDHLPQNDIVLFCNAKHCSKEINNEGHFDDDLESKTVLRDGDHSDHDDHDHEFLSSTSLLDFEDKCPPGGNDKVILYTTSLRGIRKTFEDCIAVKFLLESYKVSFSERDVSLHREFKEELWETLDGEKVIPPRLFIKGRYIGGAEEVVGVLNEQGKLRKLLEGVPRVTSNSLCIGCANMRFSVCSNCSGSRKIIKDGEADEYSCYGRCPECNENGLVKCNICY